MSNSKPQRDPYDNNVSIPSIDAMPIPPRPPAHTGYMPETCKVTDLKSPTTDAISPPEDSEHKRQKPIFKRDSGDDDTGIPPPHEDWQLTNLLFDLSLVITDNELEQMKFFFKNEMGKRLSQEITTSRDFFTKMENHGCLSRDNILHLQAMLRKLRNPELIKLTIKYARTIGDIIHFSPKTEHPEPGFRYVKFHVDGKDFQTRTRKYIENLRHTVASILCEPLQDVVIAGIEPSSSILITLMIPELYADILEDMLKDKESFGELTDIGIDNIAVGEQVYNI